MSDTKTFQRRVFYIRDNFARVCDGMSLLHIGKCSFNHLIFTQSYAGRTAFPSHLLFGHWLRY
jgi:hypothetical protein